MARVTRVRRTIRSAPPQATTNSAAVSAVDLLTGGSISDPQANAGGNLLVNGSFEATRALSAPDLAFAERNLAFMDSPGDYPGIDGVEFGNGIYVAVSDDGVGGTRVGTSLDGVRWTDAGSGPSINASSLAFGEGLFVLAGFGGEIYTSPDGITWTARASGFGGAPINFVRHLHGYFIAGGAQTVIAGPTYVGQIGTSPDGVTWTQQPRPPELFDATHDPTLTGAAYGNGRWVISASFGRFAYTTDPTGTWSGGILPPAAPLPGHFGSGRSIAFGNGIFVITGFDDGASYTSDDGINWTRHASANIYGITSFGGDKFLTVGSTGSTGFQTSTNGVIWSDNNLGGFDATEDDLRGSSYENGLWIIYGGNGNGDSVRLQTNVPPPTAQTVRGWTVGAGWTVPSLQPDAAHGAAVARLDGFGGTTGETVSNPVPIDPTESYIVSLQGRVNEWSRGYARAILRAFDEDSQLLVEEVLAELAEVEAGEGWQSYSIQFQPHRDEERDRVLPEETTTVRLVLVGHDADMQADFDACSITHGWYEAEFATAVGDPIDGNAILDGTIPGTALDTTPPAIPTNLTLTSFTNIGADGTSLTDVSASLTHPVDADYVQSEVQITGDYTGALNTLAATPVWAFARTLVMPKDHTSVTLEPAVGGAPYWARARSQDQAGNRSAWSPAAYLPATIDEVAPPIPTITANVPGYKSVGIVWNPVAASDLAYYELRWRQREQVAVGDTGTSVTVNEWTTKHTRATSDILDNLETTDAGPNPDPAVADTEAYHLYTYYSVQVRAVDLSGNTMQGRSLRVVANADAHTGDSTLSLADARGVLAGSNLTRQDGDGTTYLVKSVAMIDAVAGTLTLSPALAADLLTASEAFVVFSSNVAVQAADVFDAGWSPVVTAHPTLQSRGDIAANIIIGEMIAADSITAGHLSAHAIDADDLFVDGVITGAKIGAGQINASHIVTDGLAADVLMGGSLTLGGAPTGDPLSPAVHAVLVLLNEDEQEVGRFDGDGVVLKDPVDLDKQVRFKDGRLEFSEDGGENWSTAIDARGITADSINVGTAPGGHNSIPNSSFERPTALAGAPLSNTWTTGGSTADTTHWGGPQGSGGTLLTGSINIDTSGADLKLTDFTY